MQKPSLYERFHWLLFNAGAKIFGFLLPIWATIFGILFIVDLFREEPWYGMGWLATIVALLFCLAFGAVGVAMFKAKPFRPSKCNEYYESIEK